MTDVNLAEKWQGRTINLEKVVPRVQKYKTIVSSHHNFLQVNCGIPKIMAPLSDELQSHKILNLLSVFP